MQMLTDIDIDPAGNVWAIDNWIDHGDLCFVQAARSRVDPMRRQRPDRVLRHGQAGAHAADRPAAVPAIASVEHTRR